jgi:DGQHR domain-containing protein
MKAKDLLEIAKIDVRTRKNLNGIQRPAAKSRLRSLKNYSNSVDGCMPNTIVVNLDEDFAKINTGKLEILLHPDIMEIIDGQHRLLGFQHSDFEYDIPIAAFIGLSRRQVARVFKTINHNAKQINKSFIADLLSLTNDGSEEEMNAHQIIEKLNTDEDSPLFSRVNMTGYEKKCLVSQSNLMNSIVPLLKEGGVLQYVDPATCYRIIMKYLQAWQKCYESQWGDKNNVLTTSLGFNVMFKMFPSIHGEVYNQDTLNNGMLTSAYAAKIKSFEFYNWSKAAHKGMSAKSSEPFIMNKLLGSPIS